MKRRSGADAPVVPAASFVELVHARRGHMSVRQRVDGADLLTDRLTRGPWRRWSFLSTRAVAAAVSVLGIAATGVGVHEFNRRSAPPTPLSCVVDGGRVARAGLIEADPGAAPTLHFSDGSAVSLSPGAHVSLQHVDALGARVALAGGSAYVDITHRPGAHWSFEAGPFAIAVTGTAFRLAWNAALEELDVDMDRGSVEVSGPLSDGELALRSGQHLVVRVRDRETLIRDRDADSRQGSAGQGVPAPTNPGVGALAAPGISTPPRGASTARLPASYVAPNLDWRAMLANGDFDAIVRQAERRGLDQCIATAGTTELAALADAARYSRHDDIARRTLLAQRSRFPGSAAARDAAFLLGRLEETLKNPTSGIDWYDRYAQEGAGGTYASEAMGRRMILIEQVSGAAQARAAAADYLSHFPDGEYSAKARVLTRAP
jgi:hypothetical protein